MDMVNPRGSQGRDQPSDPMAPSSGLSPEQLAELRSWIASGGYKDPQTQLLIAKRILEQGDL